MKLIIDCWVVRGFENQKSGWWKYFNSQSDTAIDENNQTPSESENQSQNRWYQKSGYILLGSHWHMESSELFMMCSICNSPELRSRRSSLCGLSLPSWPGQKSCQGRRIPHPQWSASPLPLEGWTPDPFWFSEQVWSLTQFYSVDFSQSRIGVKSVFSTNTHHQGNRQLFLKGGQGPQALT